MVESTDTSKNKNKLDTKALLNEVLYGAVKGIGGLTLQLFTNLEIVGKENVPLRGKAILTTVSKNIMRDMLIMSQVSGRKIHFMLSPKIMRHQIAGPVLKSLGMIRSTENKDDTEPIDNVFKILNEMGDLVAMTPEAKHDRETKIKTLAAIIKFAVAADAPIIPIAVVSKKTKIFNMIDGKGFKVKVGNPLPMEKKLNRDKYRDQRYEIAGDVLNIIESLGEEPDME